MNPLHELLDAMATFDLNAGRIRMDEVLELTQEGNPNSSRIVFRLGYDGFVVATDRQKNGFITWKNNIKGEIWKAKLKPCSLA